VPHLFHLLAADDDNIGKIVGAAIFIFIWIASAIGSAVKKRQEEEKRRQLANMRGEIRDALTSSVPPLPTPPPQRRPPPLPEAILRQMPNPLPMPTASRQVPRKQVQIRTAKAKKKAPTRKQAAVAPARVAPVRPLPAAPPLAPPVAATMTSRVAMPTANAANIHRWLTPKTLHQQFILTEILQPPRAFRDDIMQ
jgi:hypothetical protein